MARGFTSRLSLVLSVVLLGACALLDPSAEAPPPTLAPTATQPPPSPTPEPEIGSDIRPIRILFTPARGSSHAYPAADALAGALHDLTGLFFETSTPRSHQEAIERFCSFPETAIAFLTAVDYVLARKACGAEVGAMSTHGGLEWSAAMAFVPRESEYETLSDLDGKTWVYPSTTSFESYLYPIHMFRQAGVSPVRILSAGNDGASVAAVYNGMADFGTAFYVPAWVDGKPTDWNPGDPFDVPEVLARFCTTTADNKAILCTNINVRDARREVRAQFSDVVQKVRVLAITPRLPNDAVSFGAGMPTDLREMLLTALFDLVEHNPEGFVRMMAPYEWTGLINAADSDFAAARIVVDEEQIGLEDLDS